MLMVGPRLGYLNIQLDPAVNNAIVHRPLISLPNLHNITLIRIPVIVIDVIIQSIHAAHCRILHSRATPTPPQQLSTDRSSGLLSGLRFLCLSIISAFPPSLQQLLDMLAVSPHLEELKLLEMAPAVEDASVRRPPIQLHDFHDLYLRGLPTTVIDVILQSIHAAYCLIVNITFTSSAQSPSPAVASFLLPSLYHQSATAQTVIMLTPWCGGFSINSEEDFNHPERAFRITVMWRSMTTDALTQWLGSLVESKTSNPRPFRLAVNLHEDMVDQFCTSKWRLTFIEPSLSAIMEQSSAISYRLR
ncbi:hypothetical protein FRB93_004276 [Tulasnella sp. JGI-2019a]|nr:hypothetical protein FRB93_004276 [Tulasnella sp. JGI-2019a]